MDWLLVLACFGIGVVVGLTGMGGGALMTPVLVLFFNVPPLTAVSSDLVAAAVMKPVGSLVHLRRGTVNLGLVKWLCLGSSPAAFAGVFVIKAVSYTHLDVYKRQYLDRPLDSVRRPAGPHRGARVLLVLRRPLLGVELRQVHELTVGGACLLYTSRCV